MNYNHQLLTIADTTCTHTHDPRPTTYIHDPRPLVKLGNRAARSTGFLLEKTSVKR